MLQACLNGGRDRDFHAAVPFTADELARDAALVIAAGASELHIHPRNADGLESLSPEVVGVALRSIRESVPNVPVGVSTHWRIPPSGRARHAPIGQWQILPDYVSVNLIEEDAVEVMNLVLNKGIGIEAGLWSVADAERFVALAEARKCLRVLIEINEQDLDEGLAVATEIIAVLDQATIDLPILLHGDEASMWPMFNFAVARGFDSRIGLEDGRLLPEGKEAEDNADLIRAAAVLAAGCETMVDSTNEKGR